jgi:hypothetical protein
MILSVILFDFEEGQEPLDKSGRGPGFRKGVLDGKRTLKGRPSCEIGEPLGCPRLGLRDSVNHHLNAIGFKDRIHDGSGNMDGA